VSDIAQLLVPNSSCWEESRAGTKFDREDVASTLQQLSDGELLLLAAKVVNSTPSSLVVHDQLRCTARERGCDAAFAK
jgi:hypothetical protein